jgi:prolyl 4-hydroxylase
MALKLSSVIEYSLLSTALYIFVLSPLLHTYFPSLILESPESSYRSFEKTDLLVIPDPDLVCDPHNYNVHILSQEPLVVYIEGFLSHDEVEHLTNISYVSYQKAPLC